MKKILYGFRYPWDWKNPVGYFAAVFLQTLWLVLIWLSISCELSLFVRFFILLGALAKDITENIAEFGDMLTNENTEQMTDNKQNQMMEKISQIVQFQAEAKEFVSIFITLTMCVFIDTFFSFIGLYQDSWAFTAFS